MAELDWTQENSALSIAKGNNEAPSVNPGYVRRRLPLPDPEKLAVALLQGDRTSLSQAITLVESTRPEHRALASTLVDRIMPNTGNSYRIGITGVPGVGKSSFIECFGMNLIEKHQRKVAVLAVDPSSGLSGGSILGDKTRMEHLSNHPHAFVRPSPSSCSLGGVARRTREAMLLCEATGFDTILVETVGVGQSETAVKNMVDFFLLLMLAGAGDELQGIKRGIMEMADGITITKADGENVSAAQGAQAEYAGALHLFPASESGWIPRVSTCSALKGTGLDDVWSMLEDYQTQLQTKSLWTTHRREQLLSWMRETLEQELLDRFYRAEGSTQRWDEAKRELLNGECSPFEAARRLLEGH